MNTIYRSLNWLLGVAFGMYAISIAIVSHSVFATLIAACASAILLPPIGPVFLEKTKIHFSEPQKIVFVLALLFISYLLSENAISNSENGELMMQLEKASIEKINKDIEVFNKNPEQVLSTIRLKVKDKNWAEAASIAKIYLSTNNKELMGLHDLAVQELEKVNVAEKIVAEEMERRVQEKSRKIAEMAARRASIENQFGYDGSHRKLERYIKEQLMNDPDSYTHIETTYVEGDDYLFVKTSFRGKNAFGGVVKNTIRAKVDLNGNVLEILQ